MPKKEEGTPLKRPSFTQKGPKLKKGPNFYKKGPKKGFNPNLANPPKVVTHPKGKRRPTWKCPSQGPSVQKEGNFSGGLKSPHNEIKEGRP